MRFPPLLAESGTASTLCPGVTGELVFIAPYAGAERTRAARILPARSDVLLPSTLVAPSLRRSDGRARVIHSFRNTSTDQFGRRIQICPSPPTLRMAPKFPELSNPPYTGACELNVSSQFPGWPSIITP